MPPKFAAAAAKAEWFSVDPRNGQNVPYSQADTDRLEQAFQNGETECKLSLGGNPFLVIFGDMMQYNNAGGGRQVCRTVNTPDAPPTPISEELAAAATSACRKMDEFVQHIETHIEANAAARARPLSLPISDSQVQAVLAVYSNIVADMQSAKYKGKYGFNPSADQSILSIGFGCPVPSYFANVAGQTIYHRKYLSLLGLRNLVVHGVTIFAQMMSTVFSGDASHYHGTTGPALMKQMTGNVVDLDSVVLRCSDPQVVSLVNANLQKQYEEGGRKGPAPPKFSSGKQLAESPAGRKIAFESASSLIRDFAHRFKLDDAEQQRRNIKLPATFEEMGGQVHVARDNSARSKWPMWLYDNVSILTFHANVPTMSDVYGALLRAPFHFVDAYLMARANDALDVFFEEALSDSCFNQKWKAIEDYITAQQSKGTIVDVLNKLHMSRADIFTQEFYEADDEKGTNELNMMQRLVASARLQGVDETTRRMRPVTSQDVRVWHAKLLEATG